MTAFLRTMALILVVCGCSEERQLETVVVSGVVTFEGKPIEEGEIRFVPESGTKGPASAASVSHGTYSISARGGVPIGTHRVEIRGYRPQPDGQPLPDRVPGLEEGSMPKEQFLPDKYNSQTTLKVDVSADHGPIVKDFEL